MYWDRYPDSPLTRHFWKGLAQMVECALSIFFFAVSPSSPRVPPFSRVFCPFPPFAAKRNDVSAPPRRRRPGGGASRAEEGARTGRRSVRGLEEGDQERERQGRRTAAGPAWGDDAERVTHIEPSQKPKRGPTSAQRLARSLAHSQLRGTRFLRPCAHHFPSRLARNDNPLNFSHVHESRQI